MKLEQMKIEEPVDPCPTTEAVARRGRGRPKVRSDEEQKYLIIQSALSLFVHQGYAATTMNEIAAQCRVSKRTLYRLFPGKMELFAGMVEAHRHMMLSFPPHDQDRPISEQLEQVFLIDIDPELEKTREGFIQFAMVEARQFPELRDIILSHGAERTRLALADWLAEANRLAIIDIVDPYAAASILMDMMFGAVAFKTGDGAQWPTTGGRKSYMRLCINYFVNGARGS